MRQSVYQLERIGDSLRGGGHERRPFRPQRQPPQQPERLEPLQRLEVALVSGNAPEASGRTWTETDYAARDTSPCRAGSPDAQARSLQHQPSAECDEDDADRPQQHQPGKRFSQEVDLILHEREDQQSHAERGNQQPNRYA